LSALSLLVGAYYAIKDRQENNKENYYFGKRSMSPVSWKKQSLLHVISSCGVILKLHLLNQGFSTGLTLGKTFSYI